VELNVVSLGRTQLRIVQVVAVLLIAFKVVQLALAGVFMDEAYYWMWGQHPALSYYDHPPLNAWLLGLSSSLLGWNILALRAPVGLTFLADIFALYLMSRRLCGAEWRPHFWLTLLLFLVTPIYWMVTAMALPDHLLLTTCLYAIHFFLGFFRDRATGGRGADRDLYLGALALGLAGLAKYNAAFLGVGLVVTIVLYDRALLGQFRLYLAAALTLLLQLPVVIWNATEHFASWEFILQGRHAGLRASFDGLLPLVVGILIFVSPFLFWPIVQFVLARKNAIPGSGLARVTFLVSSLSIVAISFTTLVLFHWNLVAYAAMLPFLAFVMRPRALIVLQSIFGIAFAVAAFVNYAVTPLTDVSGWGDEATAWSYGWEPTAQAVAAAEAQYSIGFVAAADYTTASLLGFALKDRDVTSLSANRDAYDDWFDAKAHAGEDAILFGDRWREVPKSITRQFESVTEIAVLPVRRSGKTLDTHRIYLAKGFIPHG
jgi:4-amino-4-deoxy-L-arabinose transferase-like glycosyltransferase